MTLISKVGIFYITELFRLTIQFSSLQFSHSVVSSSLWPHGLQHTRPPCPSPLPEFTQTHVHWVGDAVQPTHSLSSPCPPAFSLAQHQGLSSESVLCIRWPKDWSFSLPSWSRSIPISLCCVLDCVILWKAVLCPFPFCYTCTLFVIFPLLLLIFYLCL